MNPVKVIHLITDETRFRLLQLLLKHHYCVKALSKKLGISEPAVSQQMRILKQAHLVDGVKIGYQTHYYVNRELILSALDELSREIALHPTVPSLINDSDCACEFESECRKRDAKLLEAKEK